MTEDLDKKIAQFNAVLDQDPKNIDAFLGRGTTYLELGRYRKAIADLEQVLELQPSHAEAEEGRNRAIKLRDIDSAMEKNIIRDW